MSHSLNFETQINDVEALVRALLRVERPKGTKCFTRNQIEIHEKASMMKTYQGINLREANVIIRQRDIGLSNDIGFVKESTGFYTGVIDSYQGYDEPWLTRLYTYYNVEKSKIELEKKGIKYTEDKDEKGRIRIKARFATEKTERIKSRL